VKNRFQAFGFKWNLYHYNPDVLVHRQVAAALDAGFGGRANEGAYHNDDERGGGGGGGGKGGNANKDTGGKKKEGGGGGGGCEAPPSKAAITEAAKTWGIMTSSQLHAAAEHCNERMLAAKAVQDGSMHAVGGLCKSNPLDPQLASARFQPLSL
jgi:hypothetical protein